MSDWTPDLDRLQALDNEEWHEVERTFSGRLLAYAERRCGDLQAAEDVLQETLLGAVRGIGNFDPSYSFEQYLFGICRNRTVDHLRRRKTRTMQVGADEEGFPGLEFLALDTQTPSGIVRGRELSARACELLAEILRDWVSETWAQEEFVRLCVLEALFHGGWRNRDTWERFDLRDETAVAGIKFRALKRLRQLAAMRESGGDLLAALGRAAEGEGRVLDMDVRDIWGRCRISCPDRTWLAQLVAGSLPEGPSTFVRFHVDEMRCPWCRANLDDLSGADRAEELESLIERVHESTLRCLQSPAGDSPG